MILCFLEVFNLHLIYVGIYVLPEYKNILALLSCICVFSLQKKLTRGLFKQTVLLVKFLAQWVRYLQYFEYNTELVLVAFFSLMSSLVAEKYLSDSKAQKKELVKKLKKTKTALEILLESFPNKTVILDSEWSVKMCNQNILSFFNCDKHHLAEAIQSLRYSTKFAFENNANLKQDIESMFHHMITLDLHPGLVTYNNSIHQVSLKKVYWEYDDAVLVVLSNADSIIEAEKAEIESQYKNSMLRSVSHEMRTPMYAILSIAEQIIQDDFERLPQSTQENVLILRMSCRLMICLVNDFLDFSRILSNAFQANIKSFNVKKLLEDSMKMIEIQANKKNLQLRLRIDPSLPEDGVSDPSRIQQIIVNLLTNSIRFTHKGYIELSGCYSHSGKLKVSVKDTGIGIPPEKVGKIFKLFSSVQSDSSGCGLGLHISSLLLKALKGKDIEVKSKLGRGSKFTFAVPIAEGESSPEPNPSETIPKEISKNIEVKNLQIPSVHTYKQPQILVVDDNEFNRIIMRSNLESQGLMSLEAVHGRDAIQILFQHPGIKVVLMDCDMPVMDGWKASKEIHKLYSQGCLNNLPVIIACSAFSEQKDIEKSYKSGMALHLTKPIENEVLINTVEYFLSNE